MSLSMVQIVLQLLQDCYDSAAETLRTWEAMPFPLGRLIGLAYVTQLHNNYLLYFLAYKCLSCLAQPIVVLLSRKTRNLSLCKVHSETSWQMADQRDPKTPPNLWTNLFRSTLPSSPINFCNPSPLF
ncbi:hypothetical protein ARMGADRAFT_619005 [Armillaria gallica]|uniref:Uncharacterized protein n=1 Tax=Armillaria gallica TaxID=47427 RepID=A0A2H3CQF5_ARMGA|nr:hypothetical protein ARMGADRAFT_619005 [Armillaria gallica]